MFVLITYDIKDDKRRTKIHKALKSYGQWVQYSVFECTLDQSQYVTLRHRLGQLLQYDDSIRYYFLCQSCEPRIERQGGVMPLDDNAIFL